MKNKNIKILPQYFEEVRKGTKIADLEKKIEDDYWRRLNNGK